MSGYTGERVPVKGGCIATFKHKSRQIRAQLLIVDISVQPILSLTACIKLNLVKRVFVLRSSDTLNIQDSLMEEYKDCFEGLGCLPGLHKIHVDKSVTPVVHPCRKIPFALREKLKDELAHMEKLEVIKKVDEPTEWVSSLVVLQKRTGSLRTCLDRRDLNKAIKRQHFKLPTREGVKPDPRKTSAINNMDRPTNKDEVRRFLGMVTSLAKFVPQLSTQSAPLRSLLEQKIEWIWSHELWIT